MSFDVTDLVQSYNTAEARPYRGVLSGFKIRLHKNRLGELLVLNGALTPSNLDYALGLAKARQKPLGRVLVETGLVEENAIRQTLVEQFMLRMALAFVGIFIAFASFGPLAKQARAASIKDVPARLAFQQVAHYEPIAYYPNIFGSAEKRSTSLTAFTKWTGMFERFDASLSASDGRKVMSDFRAEIEFLRGLPISDMARGVNNIVNRQPYIEDSALYGKTDYWATPIEFLQRGGDCEDFAITKYTALRMLGVPENRLRIAIVQDMQKNIPHAVLIVYSDNGPLLLDNQIKSTVSANRVTHYRPIFSINRDAWWLHTKPRGSVTDVASASR